MSDFEISEPKKRGRPFEKGQSGNPAGKPRGSRHASTVMAEALLEGKIEALVEKLLELAQDGNMAALRLVIERLLPARRERTLQFAIPSLESAADAVAAIKSIVAALADGTLTGSEAKALTGVVDAYLRALKQTETERRLAGLEEAIPEIISRIEEMKSMFMPRKP